MKVIITFLLFVATTYEKVSLWRWKSLENSGIFFSYSVAILPFMCCVFLALTVACPLLYNCFFMFRAVLLLFVLNWNFASAQHVVMVSCVCQLLNFQQFISFCYTGQQRHVYALSVCFNFWFLLFMLFARCFCIDSKCTASLFLRLRPTQ